MLYSLARYVYSVGICVALSSEQGRGRPGKTVSLKGAVMQSLAVACPCAKLKSDNMKMIIHLYSVDSLYTCVVLIPTVSASDVCTLWF
jgi:hypothetical protein